MTRPKVYTTQQISIQLEQTLGTEVVEYRTKCYTFSNECTLCTYPPTKKATQKKPVSKNKRKQNDQVRTRKNT